MTVFQIIGITACGLVFARHMCLAFTGSSLGTLVKEGVKTMLHMTDTQLKNCIDWNIRERDKHQARSVRAQTPVNRAEAIRKSRRHQHNIEQLNDQRRRLDRTVH